MDIETVVRERRSIRRFKKDPIPEKMIREILDGARWSPSWGNTQPWELCVITGETLEKLKNANRQKILDGVLPSPDIDMPLEWPDRMKARYMGIGNSVLHRPNIAPDEKTGTPALNNTECHLF